MYFEGENGFRGVIIGDVQFGHVGRDGIVVVEVECTAFVKHGDDRELFRDNTTIVCSLRQEYLVNVV